MRVLDRYIVKIICGHVALVMAVLLTLLALFLFVNEQGWVGVGRYGNLQALRFVLLNLPASGLQFLPVGALIGSLLALGQLARASELTVMRTAGVSVARICGSVALAGMLLLPPALLVGEWVAPPLSEMARVTKAVERNGAISVTSRGGAWVRDGGRVLHADPHGATSGTAGVTVFELGEDGGLDAVSRALGARELAGGGWELQNVATSRFMAQGVEGVRAPSLRLETQGGAEFFRVVAAGDPRTLSLRELKRAVQVLAASGQDVRRHRFAFWSGIARLAAIPLAMLLAVPLLLGVLRNAEGGARATLGLVLGLAYFIGQRMVESGAIAFDLDPLLLAWLPAALLGSAVLWLLARLR